MTRRAATLAVGTTIAIALAVAGLFLPVPYVALGPGPAYDTLRRDEPIIVIKGTRTFPTDGRLDLTTVLVRDNLTLGSALAYWFDGDVAVVPREVVFPPDQSEEESQREIEREMTQSKDSARTAALRYLKVPVTTTVLVDEVVAGAPASKALLAKDLIVAVDSQPVRTAAAVGEAIRKHAVGEQVRVTFRRAGAVRTVSIGTVPSPDPDGHATIGVRLVTESTYPFVVDLELDSVGGPSAGLMFALGVVDKLTAGSLTGGRHVAGTGTIDEEGVVGPIGGIQQKLIGARKNGATVFLVPDGNWEDAVAAEEKGLQLIRVATLADAVTGLERLNQQQ